MKSGNTWITARDGYSREVIKSIPKHNLENDSDDLAFQDEALPKMKKRKQRKRHSKPATNFEVNKIGQKKTVVKGKAKFVNLTESKDVFSEMVYVSKLENAKATNILTENKLVTTKPWFSKSDQKNRLAIAVV